MNGPGIPTSFEGEPTGIMNFGDPGGLVLLALNLFLLFNVALTFIMLVWAGYQFIGSGGDTKKLTEARSAITGVIAGLVLTILSFAIISLIKGSFGFTFPLPY